MKKYVFKPYSKLFAVLFTKERQRIASYVQEEILIEHVGSTAVPGLGGKGIIDLAIGVEKDSMDSLLKQLEELRYEFKPMYSTPDRLFFKMKLEDPEEGVRMYHLHLMDLKSEDLKDLILFRDYLRSYPEEADKYGEIKRKASEEGNEDGKKYRELKNPVIQDILLKSKK